MTGQTSDLEELKIIYEYLGLEMKCTSDLESLLQQEQMEFPQEANADQEMGGEKI